MGSNVKNLEYSNPLDFLKYSLTEETITRPMFGMNGPVDEDTVSDFGELGNHEEDEENTSLDKFSTEEDLEDQEPRDIISELQKDISDLKAKITDKLKPLYPESNHKDMAEALDDATSALDLCLHHLTDLDNGVSGGEDDEPSDADIASDFEDTTEIADAEPLMDTEEF